MANLYRCKPAGAISTVTTNDLPTDRVVVSDSEGKIASSEITMTELATLDGVTENIQTQINNISGANVKVEDSVLILS